MAKATNYRSAAITIKAKKIHKAELKGDSQALEKALAKHYSSKQGREQKERLQDVVHYSSRADDVMEKYFPNSWQHPGKQ